MADFSIRASVQKNQLELVTSRERLAEAYQTHFGPEGE